MATLQIVYWRDIPAQVIVKKSRREQIKIVLDERFEKAIDRAAMRGGARETDAYLEEWRKSDPIDCGDDLQSVATRMAAELDAQYPQERLQQMVANGGTDPA